MEQIRVLLVDDHSLFRRGVAAVLAEQDNIEVVGEAADGIEAIEKARKLIPNVVVTDLMMPKCGGVEATRMFQEELPQTNVLMLTVSDKESDLFAAIKAGARGYILKGAEPEELVQAIIHIAKGGVIVSPSMAEKLLTEFKDGEKKEEEEKEEEEEASGISQRESEVLKLVADGSSNKEIAQSLFISENTVKTHLRNIMDKLHLANRSQAAAYAIRKGLTQPPEQG